MKEYKYGELDRVMSRDEFDKYHKQVFNVADLKDPNDKQGRTYREVNNDKAHVFVIGDLVELESGARLFVAKQTRDCDGAPLYSLTYSSPQSHEFGNTIKWVNGFNGENLKSIGD